MSKLMEVVGTMFFKNGKLLIDKPRSKKTFQMIGGKVENGETIREAAIRECHEELGEKALFDENLLEFVMDFEEIATTSTSASIKVFPVCLEVIFCAKVTESPLNFDIEVSTIISSLSFADALYLTLRLTTGSTISSASSSTRL